MMADLNENRKRSVKTHVRGPVKCNPRMCDLTPEGKSRQIALEICDWRIWMEREEFLALAATMSKLAKAIQALDSDAATASERSSA